MRINGNPTQLLATLLFRPENVDHLVRLRGTFKHSSDQIVSWKQTIQTLISILPVTLWSRSLLVAIEATWEQMQTRIATGGQRVKINGPRCEKTCLRAFRQCEFQNSHLSYRDQLENRDFACSKLRYGAFQKTNNKGADQNARMHRLICVFVVRKPPKTGFLAARPINVIWFVKPNKV